VTRAARARRLLDATVGAGSALILAALLLVVLWQVTVRYVPVPIPSRFATWTEELARALMLWLTTIGAAYAGGRREHLAIDLLSRKLPAGAARALDASTQGLVLAFGLLVMLVGGGQLVSITLRLEQVAASLGIPMGAVYLAMPVGGFLLSAYAFCNAVEGPPRETPPPDAGGTA